MTGNSRLIEFIKDLKVFGYTNIITIENNPREFFECVLPQLTRLTRMVVFDVVGIEVNK
jgi:hypothetical protein